MSKGRKIAIFVLGIILASVMAIVSKSLWPSDIGVDNFDSLAVKIIGFPAVASFYFLLIFSHNAFTLIQFGKDSPLSNTKTGLRFGSCFGLIYLLGMQEVMVEASPCSAWGIEYVIYEFVMGFGEALAALLLCLVFARLLLRKRNADYFERTEPRQKIVSVLVITLAFTLERAIAYETGFISSNINSFPVPTYVWTVLFGATLGVCVNLLIPIFSSEKSEVRKCIKITALTIGLSWIIFNSFIGFVFQGELWNLLLRSGLDVLTIFLATYLLWKAERAFNIKCLNQ